MDTCFEKEPVETAHKLMRINKTHDPFKLAKRLGFHMTFEDLGAINYAQRNTFCRITVITLNININKNWQRFVLAHEIGHAVLHQGFSTAFYRNNPGSAMINWAEKEASDPISKSKSESKAKPKTENNSESKASATHKPSDQSKLNAKYPAIQDKFDPTKLANYSYSLDEITVPKTVRISGRVVSLGANNEKDYVMLIKDPKVPGTLFEDVEKGSMTGKMVEDQNVTVYGGIMSIDKIDHADMELGISESYLGRKVYMIVADKFKQNN